jgi:hypothetical protein
VKDSQAGRKTINNQRAPLLQNNFAVDRAYSAVVNVCLSFLTFRKLDVQNPANGSAHADRSA